MAILLSNVKVSRQVETFNARKKERKKVCEHDVRAAKLSSQASLNFLIA
jgi:hypothetical protein